jgi:hypothetical protein
MPGAEAWRVMTGIMPEEFGRTSVKRTDAVSRHRRSHVGALRHHVVRGEFSSNGKDLGSGPA